MRSIFRIRKVWDKNIINDRYLVDMMDKRYIIEKKVLFWYYKLACVSDFQDCLLYISVYSYLRNIYLVRIYDPGGANPVMNINYNRWYKFHNIPQCKEYPIELTRKDTFLMKLDNILFHITKFFY